MKKSELIDRTGKRRNETRDALQTVYDALNQGQRKKLLKNGAVKELLLFYNVTIEEVQ